MSCRAWQGLMCDALLDWASVSGAIAPNAWETAFPVLSGRVVVNAKGALRLLAAPIVSGGAVDFVPMLASPLKRG